MSDPTPCTCTIPDARWARAAAALLSVLASTCLLTLPAANARAAGPSDVAADTFIFGGSVRVVQPVMGDLIAAGGDVRISAPVAGDAFVAGGNVRVDAPVAQSLHAVGGNVNVDAPIGRHLRAGGGDVDLGPAARVGGNVSVGGGQVSLYGPVDGSVSVGAGQVLIDSAIAGDVEVGSGQLTLGPNARLAGSLRFSSGARLVRDPAAQVAGGIETLRLSGSDPGQGGHGVFGGWFWTVGLMGLAALVVAGMPGLSQRVGDALHTRPGWSLLWGFITLVGIPLAAVLLIVTLIGIPVAVLALLLYPALLLLGYVGSAVALGRWALGRINAAAARHTGWRVAAAMGAVLLLALVGQVPVVGTLVAVMAVLAGTGAIVLLFQRRPSVPLPG